MNLNNEEEAIKCFDQAIEISPTSFDAFNYKGIAYPNLSKYKEAIIEFDKAIDLNPNLTDAYNFKGIF